MIKKILSNEEIIQELMTFRGHDTRAALMRELDITKQSMSQFCKQEAIDINNKIASLLIELIHSLQD